MASANLVTLIDQFVILVRWEINLMRLLWLIEYHPSWWCAKSLMWLRRSIDDQTCHKIQWTTFVEMNIQWNLFTLFGLINWLISDKLIFEFVFEINFPRLNHFFVITNLSKNVRFSVVLIWVESMSGKPVCKSLSSWKPEFVKSKIFGPKMLENVG